LATTLLLHFWQIANFSQTVVLSRRNSAPITILPHRAMLRNGVVRPSLVRLSNSGSRVQNGSHRNFIFGEIFPVWTKLSCDYDLWKVKGHDRRMMFFRQATRLRHLANQ